MTFTPESAKRFVEQLRDAELSKLEQQIQRQDKQLCDSDPESPEPAFIKPKDLHSESAYRFSFFDPPTIHIAISKENHAQGAIVYVNRLSIYKVSFFDSAAKSIFVSQEYPKGYKSSDDEDSALHFVLKLPTLTLDRNNVLRLIVSSESDFDLLLSWYLGLPVKQEILRNFLIDRDYRIFPNSHFEPSSREPICATGLNPSSLNAYLNQHYGTGETLKSYKKKIEEILGTDRATPLIKAKESEYFKVITHFAIISKAKQGWVNFFTTSTIRQARPKRPSTASNGNEQTPPSPSLSDNPALDQINKAKTLNDAVIHCFFARLFEGMTEQDQARYQILAMDDAGLPSFRNLLFALEKAIDVLFNFLQKDIEVYDDVTYLPDIGLEQVIARTRYIVFEELKQQEKKGYGTDTVRAALIKNATINLAINDLDAISNIQKQVEEGLPEKDIREFGSIQTESEILPKLSRFFKLKPEKLPADLIKCAKAVIKIYLLTCAPHPTSNEVNRPFYRTNWETCCVAVSAALLCDDYRNKTKINMGIRGNTNKDKLVYRTFSELVAVLESPEVLHDSFLLIHKGYEDLFNFLWTRYSITVFGLSAWYSSRDGAIAHLKVKREKLELKKEVLESLSDLSVEDAQKFITTFYNFVCDVTDFSSDAESA